MAGLDVSTVILQITSSDDTSAAALQNPSNTAFLLPTIRIPPRRKREGTPLVERDPARLVLRTTDFPFDPARGFVFGRKNRDSNDEEKLEGDEDDDETDIDIGTHRQGVSQKHFSVNFNWEARTLLLRNLSANGTGWTDPETGLDERLMTSRVLLESTQYRISAGLIELILRIPSRDDNQRAKYDTEIQRLHDAARDASPTLDGLKLRSQGKATPMVIGRGRKYILGRSIGAGTTAIVFEALDYETGDRFAAKEYTASSVSISVMFSELKLLQEMKHEHVIQYIDFFRDPGLIVVMEYAPRSLAQCEIMGDGECVTLLLHVLAGLSYLHGVEILHRDVKPDNILQTSIDPPFWKLTDFGLSKKLESGAVGTSTFCGSPLYVAPEVDGLPHSLYTKAVDLWSLGVVGVEFSVGFGSAIRENVRRKFHTALRERAKLSGLAPYLLEMLETTPEKRPSASAISSKLKDRQCCEEKTTPTSIAIARQASGADVAGPSTSATSGERPRSSKKRSLTGSVTSAPSIDKLAS